ncbi:MFS transporter [Sphingomonas sp. ID0503]|uniref:MFS transporter n=1 Tax=Sphingomonas sp. ID0503 TaxID=3399691 RepID=UPI003AFABEF2
MSDKRMRKAYPLYVLALLTLVYVLNFVDRQIVSVLGPALKAAFAVGDAELGLLFGTAFALCYALFALPLARLVDGWNRVATLALGLAAWSLVTALSALAGNFGQLAALRALVGIGEASAAPAAFSLLQDHFPPERRATAIAVYQSGIYIGIGASMALGGYVLAGWPAAAPPFGLAGWQASYLIAGLPGLALALLIALTVREPERNGESDGRSALAGIPADLAMFVPGLSSLTLAAQVSAGAARRQTLVLAATVAFTVTVIALTDPFLSETRRTALANPFGVPVTTNVVQWVAIGLGIHGAAGWLALLRHRNPAAFAATAGARAFRLLAIGGGVVSVAGYAMAGFTFTYGKQALGLTPADAPTLGLIACVMGGAGTILAGLLADAAHRRSVKGRIFVAITVLALAAAAWAWMLTARDMTQFYAANAAANLLQPMWLAPIFAAAQDRVAPDQRGTATALQFLGTNLIGLGLGPYLVGLISDATGDLCLAMLLALATIPLAMAMFWRAGLSVAPAKAGVHVSVS